MASKPPHNRTPSHVLAMVQTMIDAGASRRQIIEATGIGKDNISRWVNRGWLTRFPDRPSPLYVKPLSGAAKRRLRGGVFGLSTYIPVPSWVPSDLRDDYRDIACLNGEERAARIVSGMKAEALRAEV